MSEETRRQFCRNLKDLLKDEDKASIDYLALAEKFDTDVPEEKMLANLLRKIADDEMSHSNALSRAKDILRCPIE